MTESISFAATGDILISRRLPANDLASGSSVDYPASGCAVHELETTCAEWKGFRLR
ncbi:hypothetical protein [Paenibacillus thiaminolyticus]|uniref:hypothetical protein n=1 Tax=Paenibacillus thiaminolyticus TaxID=49283 RepID=UPI00160064DF|nr:hypothetical protein [Paenibacillus thiaminolyticus]